MVSYSFLLSSDYYLTPLLYKAVHKLSWLVKTDLTVKQGKVIFFRFIEAHSK